ncbi:ribosome recycling factor [Actinoalloteichus hymeniacidonis]|nr:ribosome recycling factor [Actinoalloteichus hymeniacidonis]
MEKAVAVAKDELAHIRTGRATPSMFNNIVVEYYGEPTPLNQVAGITIPEVRQIVVKPYDASLLDAIEKAIRSSDLGVNPSNDGNIIRVLVPQLSEERRRDLVKVAKNKGEESKVTIRNLRRKVKDEIDRAVKDGDAGEDAGTRAEKELQSLTDKYVAQVEELVRQKESELLEV